MIYIFYVVLCDTHRKDLNAVKERKEAHRNSLRDGLAQKSVAYEIPRGCMASPGCGLFAVSLVTSPRIHDRSSHALSAVVVIPAPLFPDAFLHRAIPPLRARNHPSMNYAWRVIATFNWHSHILLGKFAGRQSNCITWRRCLSNAFCYSLFISIVARI